MALPDPILTAALESEEQCVAYLENLRWPGGVACPNCRNQKISRFQAKGKSGKTRQICQCLDRDCKYQFSATTGTIFHDSHLPLSKWYEAMRLLADPAGGTSVNQLRFVLGVQYKTAKSVAERIQRALAAGTIELVPSTTESAVAKATGVRESAPAKKAAPKSRVAAPKTSAAHARAPRPPAVKPKPTLPKETPMPPVKPVGPPTVVDSMLSVFTSAMNLSVRPPLAAVNYLKKKILD
jgi:transposase-like protein